MLQPIKINIKPLSINQAYKGKRFITPAYGVYKAQVYAALPKDLKLPEPPYFIHYTFGFSSNASDFDNCIKTTTDCIAMKYCFNDKLIRKALIDIEMVPKGKEFFTFKIETLTK